MEDRNDGRGHRLEQPYAPARSGVASMAETVAYGGHRSPPRAAVLAPRYEAEAGQRSVSRHRADWENQTEEPIILSLIPSPSRLRGPARDGPGRCGVPPLEGGVEETTGSDQGEGVPPHHGHRRARN